MVSGCGSDSDCFYTEIRHIKDRDVVHTQEHCKDVGLELGSAGQPASVKMRDLNGRWRICDTE